MTEIPHRRLLQWMAGRRPQDRYAVVALVTAREWCAYLAWCPHQTESAFLDVANNGARLEAAEARAFARNRWGLGELPYRP